MASSGRCSQSVTPGADVAIGSNGPRYSAGAFGFMSHMSMCDAPPHRKNRMVDLALPPEASTVSAARLERAGFPNATPPIPRLEATRNVRRETAFRRDIRASLRFRRDNDPPSLSSQHVPMQAHQLPARVIWAYLWNGREAVVSSHGNAVQAAASPMSCSPRPSELPDVPFPPPSDPPPPSPPDSLTPPPFDPPPPSRPDRLISPPSDPPPPSPPRSVRCCQGRRLRFRPVG